MWKKTTLIGVMSFCVFGFLEARKAEAAAFLTLPSTTFEVIDGGSRGQFDGRGDELFPGNFSTVVKGSLGENSQMAEFDISDFLIPPEEITEAVFQVTGLSNLTTGFGTNGERPTSLAVRGFVGNGQADTGDFQAGNILGTANVSANNVQETYDFNVTNYLKELIRGGNTIAGFGVRAQSNGGITLADASSSGDAPRLIIYTDPLVASTVPEPSLTFGLLAIAGSCASLRLRRKR